MLSQLINEQLIQLNVQATDWEDALRKSAAPLLQEGKITEEYVEKIIEITREVGPYIVLSKHVALPHAPFQFGALEKAIGITTLSTPVTSGNTANDPVKYLICLSAIDNHSHLEALASLTELLGDEKFFTMLDKATNVAEVMQYIRESTKEC